MLNEAIRSVLRYAQKGSDPLVVLTALANGVGEEVFFRGALFAAIRGRYPVLASTAIYTLAATATRNPALVLASGAMGALFGLQRRATGGIQAPVLTHLTWSTLMLRFLPPLLDDPPRRPARAHTPVNAMRFVTWPVAATEALPCNSTTLTAACPSEGDLNVSVVHAVDRLYRTYSGRSA